MNPDELRQKTVNELQALIIDARREQFNLRMQQGSGQETRPHAQRAVRREIARLKTILREKEVSATNE